MTRPNLRLTPTAPPLVERAEALASIGSLIDAVDAGSGQALVVRGIGGIGKSSLLDRAAEQGEERGWLVLRARADEPEQDFSFGVAVQLFEAALGARPADARDQAFDGPAGLARPLLDSHGHRLPDESDLFSTLHGLYWLTVNLADERPVFIVVDDAQWADLASLRFLQYLARRLEDHRIALLVGTRPVDGDVNGPLLGSLARHGVIEPRPLSPGGIAQVVQASHPELTDGEVARWHGITGGVPLYVQELLRSGGPDGTEGTDLDGSLSTVLVRLESLAPSTRKLVEAAAIVGEAAPWWEVMRMAGVEDADGAGHQALVDAALLQPDETVRFVHPAIRESIEASLHHSTRQRLHASAAELLEARSAPAELVAHHLLLSAPTGSDHHAEVLRQAAGRARVGGSPALAQSWLHRALAEGPSPELRAQVLGDLAVVAAATGHDWAEPLAAYLALIDDPTRRAEVRLRVGRALTHRGVLGEAADVLEAGLEDRSGSDGADALTLELVAGLAITSRIDASGRHRIDDLIEDSLARAKPGTESEARALLSFLAYDRALVDGPADEVRSTARAAILHPDVTDDEVLRSTTYYPAVLALQFADDAAGVDAATARGLEVAERRASELLFGLMSNGRGILRLAQGRAAEALDDLEAAAEVMRRNRSVTLPGALGNVALCQVVRGELDEARRAIELPDGGGGWHRSSSYTHWLFARGAIRLASDEPEGIDDLRTVLQRQRALGATNPATIPAAFALAEALGPGAPADVRRAFDEAAVLAVSFDAPRTLAMMLRVQAVLEPGRAVDHLRRADGLIADGPWGLERMRVRLALGRALTSIGSLGDAREPLRLALAEADRNGAASLSTAAHAALIEAGARPRRAALVGPAALTPTERQVAELAAEGLTNREIATRRFVSVKAVEFQLAHAYRKLGITARAQLDSVLDPDRR